MNNKPVECPVCGCGDLKYSGMSIKGTEKYLIYTCPLCREEVPVELVEV